MGKPLPRLALLLARVRLSPGQKRPRNLREGTEIRWPLIDVFIDAALVIRRDIEACSDGLICYRQLLGVVLCLQAQAKVGQDDASIVEENIPGFRSRWAYPIA